MFWRKKKEEISDEEYNRLVAEFEQYIDDKEELEELINWYG